MRAGSTAAAWTSPAKAAVQSESLEIQEYLVHSAPIPQPEHAACVQELCTVLLVSQQLSRSLISTKSMTTLVSSN